MATNYFRADGWVKSANGQAIAGAQIYVCSPQPANVGTVPPSPLATIYSDPLGANPITQPIIADGFGHYDFYALQMLYTLVVVNTGIEQVYYPDQSLGGVGSGGTVPTPPAGSSGNIQGNNAGVFGGVPGSSIDFTNGLVSLAPTGTGIALSVTGDAVNSAVQSWYLNGAPGASASIKMNGNPAGGVVLIVTDPSGNYSTFGPAWTDGGSHSYEPGIGIAQPNTLPYGANCFLGTYGMSLNDQYGNAFLAGYNSASSSLWLQSSEANLFGTAAITHVAETTGHVVTLTLVNSNFNPGQSATILGLSAAAWINGYTVTLITATATQCTFNDPNPGGSSGLPLSSTVLTGTPSMLIPGSVGSGPLLQITGDGTNALVSLYVNNSFTSPVFEVDTTGNLHLSAGLYDSNAAVGTNGQTLLSTGSGVVWGGNVATSGQGGFWGPGIDENFPYGGTAGATTVSTTQNQITVWQFTLKYAITIRNMSVDVTSTSAVSGSTFNAGIFSTAGVPLIQASFDAHTATGIVTASPSAVTIPPGTYYYGQSASQTSIQVAGAEIGSETLLQVILNTNGVRVGTAANLTSGGVMPSLGTITKDASNFFYPGLVFFEP